MQHTTDKQQNVPHLRGVEVLQRLRIVLAQV